MCGDRGRAEGLLTRGYRGGKAPPGQLLGLEPRAAALAPVVITFLAPPASGLPRRRAFLPHLRGCAGGGGRPRVAAGRPSLRERLAGPVRSRAARPAPRVGPPLSSGRGGPPGRLAWGVLCASPSAVSFPPPHPLGWNATCEPAGGEAGAPRGHAPQAAVGCVQKSSGSRRAFRKDGPTPRCPGCPKAPPFTL